jgi:hypothetical protein
MICELRFKPVPAAEDGAKRHLIQRGADRRRAPVLQR